MEMRRPTGDIGGPDHDTGIRPAPIGSYHRLKEVSARTFCAWWYLLIFC